MPPEQSDRLQRTAIDTKDSMLKQINNINSLQEFFITAAPIGTALNMTQGLWNELGYSYKAKEILEELKRKLDQLVGDNQPSDTDCIKILIVKLLLNTQIDSFHQLQQERMNRDASLN